MRMRSAPRRDPIHGLYGRLAQWISLPVQSSRLACWKKRRHWVAHHAGGPPPLPPGGTAEREGSFQSWSASSNGGGGTALDPLLPLGDAGIPELSRAGLPTRPSAAVAFGCLFGVTALFPDPPTKARTHQGGSLDYRCSWEVEEVPRRCNSSNPL